MKINQGHVFGQKSQPFFRVSSLTSAETSPFQMTLVEKWSSFSVMDFNMMIFMCLERKLHYLSNWCSTVTMPFLGQPSSPLLLYVSNRADKFVSRWHETSIIHANVFHWLISLLSSQILNTHISFNYFYPLIISFLRVQFFHHPMSRKHLLFPYLAQRK